MAAPAGASNGDGAADPPIVDEPGAVTLVDKVAAACSNLKNFLAPTQISTAVDKLNEATVETRRQICELVWSLAQEQIGSWPRDKQDAWHAYRRFLHFRTPLEPDFYVCFAGDVQKLMKKKKQESSSGAEGAHTESSVTWQELADICQNEVKENVLLLGVENDGGQGKKALGTLKRLEPYFQVAESMGIPWKWLVSGSVESLANIGSVNALGYALKGTLGVPVGVKDFLKAKDLRKALLALLQTGKAALSTPSNLIWAVLTPLWEMACAAANFATGQSWIRAAASTWSWNPFAALKTLTKQAASIVKAIAGFLIGAVVIAVLLWLFGTTALWYGAVTIIIEKVLKTASTYAEDLYNAVGSLIPESAKQVYGAAKKKISEWASWAGFVSKDGSAGIKTYGEALFLVAAVEQFDKTIYQAPQPAAAGGRLHRRHRRHGRHGRHGMRDKSREQGRYALDFRKLHRSRSKRGHHGSAHSGHGKHGSGRVDITAYKRRKPVSGGR